MLMKFIVTALFCFSAIFLSAQEGMYNAEEKAREMTTVYTEKYQLRSDQADKMEKIQLRKFLQINKLSLVKDQDPVFYIEKMEALDSGTDGSIRLLLDERQLANYIEDQIELRKKLAELVAKLKKEGKSELEIREASLMW